MKLRWQHELAKQVREGIVAAGGVPFPAHQRPWREIQRGMVDRFNEELVLKPAVKHQRNARKGLPHDNP